MQLTIYQGESKILDYSITDASGMPVDLSEYVARWRMTRRYDEVALVDKSLGVGIEYIDAPGGLLAVTLDPDETALPPGTYRRELRLESGTTQRYTADAGIIKIVDSIFVE